MLISSAVVAIVVSQLASFTTRHHEAFVIADVAAAADANAVMANNSIH